MEGHPPATPVFGLFIVLTGAQWLVHTRVDQMLDYPAWINDPSFNIYMLAPMLEPDGDAGRHRVFIRPEEGAGGFFPRPGEPRRRWTRGNCWG